MSLWIIDRANQSYLGRFLGVVLYPAQSKRRWLQLVVVAHRSSRDTSLTIITILSPISPSMLDQSSSLYFMSTIIWESENIPFDLFVAVEPFSEGQNHHLSELLGDHDFASHCGRQVEEALEI
jgi:hypothetical protein